MFTVSDDLKQCVNARIAQCHAIIVAYASPGQVSKLTIPVIKYDINSARLGGEAINDHTIRLNPVFLNQYTDHYIEQTVAHEYCHIVQFQLYGRNTAAHGREWKNLMRICGLKADRCHQYKAPEGVILGKPKAKFNYVCDTCGSNVIAGPTHHRKMQGGASLYHSGCGTKSRLKYVGDLGRVDYTQAKKAASNNQYVAPVVNATQFKVPKAGTKLHDCYGWYIKYKGVITRKDMIGIFVKYCGCTSAGAATYYNILSKG